MKRLKFAHDNNCSRCPIIGAEDVPGDEYYELRSLRFRIRIARELSRGHDLIRVEPRSIKLWLRTAYVDQKHVDHIPANAGPGIMVTLPNGCGQPIIDGNHRAARALRDGADFFVVHLNEAETLTLLQRTMGATVAIALWWRLGDSRPHPDDA
jgi:hypothetical protein